jgi:hypothetical protein
MDSKEFLKAIVSVIPSLVFICFGQSNFIQTLGWVSFSLFLMAFYLMCRHLYYFPFQHLEVLNYPVFITNPNFRAGWVLNSFVPSVSHARLPSYVVGLMFALICSLQQPPIPVGITRWGSIIYFLLFVLIIQTQYSAPQTLSDCYNLNRTAKLKLAFALFFTFLLCCARLLASKFLFVIRHLQ